MNVQGKQRIKSLFAYALHFTAFGFLALGTICLLLVLGMIYNGDAWAYIIYAEKPIHHFLGGIGALFIFYLLFYGIYNSPKEWGYFSAKVLLATISLTISLVAGELSLRIYYSALQNNISMEKFKLLKHDGKPMPIKSTHALAAIIQPSENSKVIYELQPNLDRKFGHRRVLTNTEGMREDHDYSIKRNNRSIRIVGIGDSGMFGWNIEQNDDYLSVLETNLNQRQDGNLYEVLNLAVPGYNTQLEIEILRSKGLKYKPDIVIVGWCDNDFSLPFFMLEKENYRRRDKSFLYSLLFKRNSEKKKRSNVAPGFKITDQRDFEKDRVLPELTAGSDIDRVRTALKELKKLSEQENFKVLFFGPMGKDICNICTEIGVAFSNTHVLIPRDKYPSDYIIHFMHPNKKGHAVLAEHLEKDLINRGWLPARKQSQ
ncbi:MAG: hypothetical protein A2283_05675 [Lentisphaerae bacterium RIFOXYA12_FULL_48_11]|nr:MAG: hypothetical protein A2283_05675 [Lentisphaerae bacterium RIFOXYA12_FULL_48_11]